MIAHEQSPTPLMEQKGSAAVVATVTGAVDRDLTESLDEAMVNLEQRLDLHRALHALPFAPSVKSMVSMRFGLDGEGEHSCEELGRCFRLSNERVRVVINKAIWKMAQSGILADYRSDVKGGVAA